MNRKTLWFSVILLITGGLSTFLMITRESKTTLINVSGGVNAFMIKPNYIDYDKMGKLHSQLRANQIIHYTRQDTSIFTKPRILVYTDNQIPWYITADHGKSQNGTEKIFLNKNVILHQPARPNYPETTITTSELTIYPNRSFAETHKNVEIKQPGTLIRGTGVEADLKKGIIKLLQKSRGTYEPTTAPFNKGGR